MQFLDHSFTKLCRYARNLEIIPRLSTLSPSCFLTFSKARNVEIKNVTKHNITAAFKIIMSMFFILFFQFKVKENQQPNDCWRPQTYKNSTFPVVKYHVIIFGDKNQNDNNDECKQFRFFKFIKHNFYFRGFGFFYKSTKHFAIFNKIFKIFKSKKLRCCKLNIASKK